MKPYLLILLAGLGMAGCAHNGQQGGTYNHSGSYQGSGAGEGSSATDPYHGSPSGGDIGSTRPPSADRSPGANEHSPPPVSNGVY